MPEALLNIFAIVALIFTMILLFSAVICLFSRVPYVPTKKRIIPRLLAVADLKKNMKVYDLGCGDGRLLFEAEKRYQTCGVGYELSPVAFLMAITKKIALRCKSKIYFKNIFQSNLKDANRIFLYLTPQSLKTLAEKLRAECRPGARVITHTFHIEGLQPEKVIAADKTNKFPAIYIYKM